MTTMTTMHADVTKEKLYEDFNTVVAETEQLLKSLAGAGADTAGAVQASVGQGLAAAGERLAQIRAASIEQAKASAHATDEYVHGHPWQSIGTVAAVAAVAGLAAGLLIARR